MSILFFYYLHINTNTRRHVLELERLYEELTSMMCQYHENNKNIFGPSLILTSLKELSILLIKLYFSLNNVNKTDLDSKD